MLEAAGMITALRSFRTAETQALIQHDQSEARIRAELTHEHESECEVMLQFTRTGKQVVLNGDKLPRLGNLIGRFPTVALSADDINLLRGAPALRRRMLDMTLSVSSAYFSALTRYHRALRQRNAALRQERPQASLLEAFEHEMAPHAASVTQLRRTHCDTLAAHLKTTYQTIAAGREQPALAYQCSSETDTAKEFLTRWREGRTKDIKARSTRHGPHRDDLLLQLEGAPAREYASEGQQRALVLALRLAEAAFVHEQRQARPVILADDILGQLDPERQERFWHALGGKHQVLATGTLLPSTAPAEAWRVFTVESGTFRENG